MNTYALIMVALGVILAFAMVAHSLNLERTAIGITIIGVMASLLVIIPSSRLFFHHFETGEWVVWNYFRISNEHADHILPMIIMTIICQVGYVWIACRANTCRQAEKLAA